MSLTSIRGCVTVNGPGPGWVSDDQECRFGGPRRRSLNKDLHTDVRAINGVLDGAPEERKKHANGEWVNDTA